MLFPILSPAPEEKCMPAVSCCKFFGVKVGVLPMNIYILLFEEEQDQREEHFVKDRKQ